MAAAAGGGGICDMPPRHEARGHASSASETRTTPPAAAVTAAREYLTREFSDSAVDGTTEMGQRSGSLDDPVAEEEHLCPVFSWLKDRRMSGTGTCRLSGVKCCKPLATLAVVSAVSVTAF